ncbi:hypothetical protein [Streptomyces anandii]|uniref:hypothetical protein n=1 Tax=Streptomyces anandii TaxID=285454 RepID=UPI0037A985DA
MADTTYTDPVITRLRAELTRARRALAESASYFSAQEQASAVLNCTNPETVQSPLHRFVASAIASVDDVLEDTSPGEEQHGNHVARLLAGIIADLDRCPHGRHHQDPCGRCSGGRSTGNPHLTAGQRIGYSIHGTPIYVPKPEDRYAPEAWRKPPTRQA